MNFDLKDYIDEGSLENYGYDESDDIDYIHLERDGYDWEGGRCIFECGPEYENALSDCLTIDDILEQILTKDILGADDVTIGISENTHAVEVSSNPEEVWAIICSQIRKLEGGNFRHLL
jgi:hypothetical protein